MSDSIIRCDEHLKNFTLLDNTCLKTSTLSMQAMGLFAYLMTLPSDWVVYKSELVNHFSNGRDAVYKAFNELVDAGFITFVEKKNDKGQFNGYEYYIHERPVSEEERTPRKERKTDSQEPETEKPLTEKPYPGNPSLLSTNKPSTDNTNSKSHCCGSATTKKDKVSFKNEDYNRVFSTYYENCRTLFAKGLIQTEAPVVPRFIKQAIKKCFEAYGVDKVVEGVVESINHDWLIKQGYPLNFILGQNELPMLINKTYRNSNSVKPVKQFQKLGKVDDYLIGGEGWN